MKIHNKLRPFIFTIIGLLPMAILLICFLFIPSGADLTSEKGDYYLGKIAINFIELGLFIDLVRFFISKMNTKK